MIKFKIKMYRLKSFNNSKAFTEYSNDSDVIRKNIEDYNSIKKCKVLMVFDMITDILSNENLSPIATELFISAKRLNIALVFIKQSYFAVPKNIRLISTLYFVMKYPNKSELQLQNFKHSSDKI